MTLAADVAPLAARRATRRLHLLCLAAVPLLGVGTAVWWWLTPGMALPTRTEHLGWASLSAVVLAFIWRAAQASGQGRLDELALWLWRAGGVQLAGCALELAVQSLTSLLEQPFRPLWWLGTLGVGALMTLLASLPGLGLLSLSVAVRHIASLRRDEALTI
ncbi:hypothetical protein [Deinococcus arcticus]|uniref:DUF2975 domain-containing protein n=1 Tax=Deinococcus arcticus TaxID=2136176 RepID=A0A2T3W923_9DEIO|nr:hypothetical protein [Deinococcus arcticus]PTA68382.1 hypothetical protein C8263_08085 [Deinococcus arcticus]